MTTIVSLTIAQTGFADEKPAPLVTTDPEHPAPQPVAAAEVCRSHKDTQHLVGLAVDVTDVSYTATARYMHGHRDGEGCGGLGVMVWYGYGAEVGVADSAAMITQAVGRAGMAGDA